jgi:hypothetical protein
MQLPGPTSSFRVGNVHADGVQQYGEPGEFFFHFTTAETALNFILPSGQLRLSPFTSMRDPWENKHWRLSAPIDEPAWVYASIQHAVGVIHDGMFLLSMTCEPISEENPGLSSLPSERGYGRPRMWEQYGENFAGACLCFDRPRLRKAVVAHLPDTTAAGQVQYRHGGFSVSPARVLPRFGIRELEERLAHASENEAAEIRVHVRSSLTLFPDEATASATDADLLGMSVAQQFEQYVLREQIHEFFFLKDVDYASEREFRYTHWAPGRDFIYLPYQDALRCVILGPAFPLDRIEEARTLCAAAGSDLRQLDWSGPWPQPMELAAAI